MDGEFIKAYENYHLAALSSASALLSQREALKAKKVDPAIAGGIAQSIAGIGAGIYSATTQAQRNQLIDEARKNASSQVLPSWRVRINSQGAL